MNQLTTTDLNQQLARFNELEAELIQLEKDYAGVVYNLDDANQLKNAKADRYKIGKFISRLETTRKDIKKPLKVFVDQIDGTGKGYRDRAEALQDPIKNQLDAREQRIQEHQDMLDAKVQAIRDLQNFDPINPPDSNQVQAQLAAVAAIVVDETYEDRAAEAMVAQKEVIANLEKMLKAVAEREAEQAELRRLQQEQADRERREREEKIAKEAAEKARREAEAAAAKKQADQEEESRKRVEDAERKVREAEERAWQEKEQREREQAAEAAKAEAARKAEESRQADEAHRAQVELEIVDDLSEFCKKPMAESVLHALKESYIRHVKIEY